MEPRQAAAGADTEWRPDLEPGDEAASEPEARAAVMTGVWVSGARCVVQYVLAPSLGLAGFWLPWLSQLVQILACLVAVSGALRLHQQRDRRRHLYAAIAALVLCSTLGALLRPWM